MLVIREAEEWNSSPNATKLRVDCVQKRGWQNTVDSIFTVKSDVLSRAAFAIFQCNTDCNIDQLTLDIKLAFSPRFLCRFPKTFIFQVITTLGSQANFQCNSSQAAQVYTMNQTAMICVNIFQSNKLFYGTRQNFMEFILVLSNSKNMRLIFS